MTPDQTEAQQALQHLAESKEWWKDADCLCYDGPNQRLDIVCPNHDLHGGKVPRYPYLFEAVFRFSLVHTDCKIEGRCFVDHDPFRYAGAPNCHGTGYLVRPMMEFWWYAPQALEKDGFHNAGVVAEPHSAWNEGRHPVLALIEALEQVLPAKEAEHV